MLLLIASVGTYFALRQITGAEDFGAVLVAGFTSLLVILVYYRDFGLFPRLLIWKGLTFTFWLFGLVLIWGLDHASLVSTWQVIRFVDSPANKGRVGDILTRFFSDGYTLTSDVAWHSWLVLWTVFAMLALFWLGNRPLNWAAFPRFRWVFLCTLACAGYPLGRFVYGLLDGSGGEPGVIVLRAILPPLLLPVAGLASFAAVSLTLFILTFAFRLMLVTLPLLAFDYLNDRDNKAHIRAQKKQGIASYMMRFHHWLRGEATPETPDDSKGARFAGPQEVAAVWNKDGMGFGHYDGQPLRIETDKHVLIMASTRSGKGVTLIIPHLLRYPGSCFVLDPKSENARACGRQRAKLNSTVHYLDPFGISGKPRSRFNPLAHFRPETMEAQSKSLAAALILETTRDHWTASAQQLLAAVILYVVATPDLPPARKDLVLVRKLLLGVIDQTLRDMSECDLADGLVADLANSFLRTPDRERGSIISTAQRETEILDNPAIVACLSATGPGPEVDFALWHRSTMSVFLCLSAPRFPVFNRWLRLVLSAALDEMTDRLNPPALPVCFMLDELATLGHLSTIENAVGLAAGYGVQLVTVWQDVAQMRDLYKGRWASFVGNSGVRALFSLDDYETADYWSKFMGGRLFPTSNEQRDIWGLAQGSSAGETMRTLMSPEELMMRYATGKMLVLKQGSRPVEADRVPYFADKNLAGLWDDPRRGP